MTTQTDSAPEAVSGLQPLRIDQLFAPGRPLTSFEFFPPKNEAGSAQLFQAVDELRVLRPDFVSITRTGGGTPATLDLTARIQNELHTRAAAHMTCVGHTKLQMEEYLDRLWADGVRNIIALRGDIPGGQLVAAPEDGFCYASDLVPFVRARHDFCIGVAGYPEGHPQCLNLTRDLEHLKQKLDNGSHFVITQLFFDNADFYRWRDNARRLGITAPLIAGIMPILSVSQIKQFVLMCGAKIPHALLVKLESLESDPMAVHAAGVEHAIQQCEDLLVNGVDGLHYYTLNRSKATVLIEQALQRQRAA